MKTEKAGSAQAQALLMALGQGNYPDEILLPDEHRMAPMHAQLNTAEVPTTLTAYPNPAKDQVYIVYDLPEGAEKAELRVMDALGRLIDQRDVSLTNRIADLSLKNAAGGVLVCGLYVDGTLMSTTKVDVVR